jgi:hypothetical protein
MLQDPEGTRYAWARTTEVTGTGRPGHGPHPRRSGQAARPRPRPAGCLRPARLSWSGRTGRAPEPPRVHTARPQGAADEQAPLRVAGRTSRSAADDPGRPAAHDQHDHPAPAGRSRPSGGIVEPQDLRSPTWSTDGLHVPAGQDARLAATQRHVHASRRARRQPKFPVRGQRSTARTVSRPIDQSGVGTLRIGLTSVFVDD